jgi:hypothetical protein
MIKKILNILIAFTILIISERCHKPCNEPDYTFIGNDVFSPEKDTLNVGDTLWLNSSINKELVDTSTKKSIDFSNAANLGSTVVISDINKFQDKRGAIDSFDYIKITGNIFSDVNTDTSNVKQLQYSETASSFELKIGFVAKKAGSYIFTIPDNPYLFRKGQPKCGTAKIIMLNSNTDQHLYLFENMWGALSSYDSARSYCIEIN